MKLNKDTDLILWAQLKDGDIDALGGLYDLFIDELFSYGVQFCADRTVVMDSIHDVFLNLYKYRKKLANTDQVKYYLFRSLKNQIISSLKGELLDQAFMFNDDVYINKYSNSIEEEIIETEFNNEQTYKLSKAINSLSKKQRKGLFLRFTEERDYEEIAQIMNVSVQTSRTLVYRAIKTLRKNMLVGVFCILKTFF
ncbi:sigma-70 family RNA polymerase sigma factor [Winogradskyella damuponensis]|uniref:Sigma-70 family RNA polymerase sigma factor n=1 Tax=Winogradskyella damuponensis TaxID=943939 RepID=A0ABP8CK46_9FLAO